MFQSFTGSSRRPRQVNLSNRTSGPFGAPGPGRYHPSGLGPQATIALAQQGRIQRQLERERLSATKTLQRVWRGHRSRKQTKDAWRKLWDFVELQRKVATPIQDIAAVCISPTKYSSATECANQLRLLLMFINIEDVDDTRRLLYFAGSFRMTLEDIPTEALKGNWTILLATFVRAILKFLPIAPNQLLPLLTFIVGLVPKQIAREAQWYYTMMAKLTVNLSPDKQELRDQIVQAVLALLTQLTSETLSAYEWFARLYLTIPSLDSHLGTLDDISVGLNYKILASALDSSDLESWEIVPASKENGRLWLVAYLIYFYRHAHGDGTVNQGPETLLVRVISKIVGPATGDISKRIFISENRNSAKTQLPPFIKEQLLSLINQQNITRLLPGVTSTSPDRPLSDSGTAKNLAGYALMLLSLFPRRGDEIRMWLYLGSTTIRNHSVPAIRYFWDAASSTKIFHKISSDSYNVIGMLLPASLTSQIEEQWSHERDQEWTVILLFLELYTFLLKVLDDDEFFSADSPFAPKISRTQESALPLHDVKRLTIFLKNLGFALYWNTSELTGSRMAESSGLGQFFGLSSAVSYDSTSHKNVRLGGVVGIPLDYFKGLVTGLLRMIHERDSRRNFLPPNHWLMTDRFNMEGFIPKVVSEEEERDRLQESEDYEDEDESEDEIIDEDTSNNYRGLIGTAREQEYRRREDRERRQRQAARQKELESVAPRLEILRNIPFFIPFETRVRIFREFVYRDQLRRRGGNVDPDAWRMSFAHANFGPNGLRFTSDVLRKHHAQINRKSLFHDAYEQFYALGDGLKEPIQISFIDQWGALEAGIDGGGVTKEFLTSVIEDAFNPTRSDSMFLENEHHLLYPNPTIVEQHDEIMKENGFSQQWRSGRIQDLLKRYEFLGRIIGKCLYEGILADVRFAGFFLLKWALTGGSNSARKESSYRASLNDVRDLDEGLYQGLIQLKNYQGNVEDLDVNFTITDVVRFIGQNGIQKSINLTRDLIPNGSCISVTNQNRLVYISYVARYRLQAQPRKQTSAFLQGLGQIIQPSWLSMFNQSELQRLVGGDSGDIDVEDLRRNTIYGGLYVIGDDLQEHPTICIFWEVMREMSNEERRKVIQFVTSTPRAPLLGFSHLNPKFSIRDSSRDTSRLPSTSTCANLLKLPLYSDRETLKQKLMYAITAGAGFDLS